MVYRRIVVPTDLTDRTIEALDVALSVAVSQEATVTLLHVIETIAGAEFEELASFYRTLEDKASNRLREIVARVPARGVAVDTAIVYGKRGEEVLRFIRENVVELVVLASHPVDPSHRDRGLGTMSYKLATFAPCSVLLVK